MTDHISDVHPGSPISGDERQALEIIAALIIPASAEYGVPGADDPSIMAEILTTAAPHRAKLQRALASFAEIDAQDPEQRSAAFRQKFPAEAELLQTLVVQCYYRDDRVLMALGMEPRPPFPLGYTVEQGDWSLLDPVRARPEIYRKAP